MPDSEASADVLNPSIAKTNVIFYKVLLLNYGVRVLKQNIFQFNYIIKFINIFKKAIKANLISLALNPQ